MKKFLTVLLALSVVFTYSFSSVGAVFADSVQDTAKAQLLLEAKENAEKAVNTYYDEAMKVVKTQRIANYIESSSDEDYADAWKTIDAKAQTLAAISAKYSAEISGNFGKYTAGMTAEDYADAVFGINFETTDTAGSLTTEVSGYIWNITWPELLYNLYTADRDEYVSRLDKIDWSLYSDKATNSAGQTYLKEAQEKVAVAKEFLAEYKVYTLAEVKQDATAYDTLQTAIDAVEAAVMSGTAVTPNGKYSGITATYYDNGTLYPTKLYKVNGVDTIKDNEDADRDEAATIAEIKARIQKNYADYMKTANADKKYADNYVALYSYLAEEGQMVLGNVNIDGHIANIKATYETRIANAIKAIEDLDAYAAKYKAEKDANGNFVRDAAKIDEIVVKAKTWEYVTAVGATNTVKSEDQITAAEAKKLIEALSVDKTTADLAFAKEVAKKALTDKKAEIIDDYYPLEAAKVEANYEKALAQIEAATTVDKVKAVSTNIESGIAIKSVVDGKVSYVAGTAAKADFDAVVAYVKYANSGKNPIADDYITWTDASIKDALNTLYGEQGARTNAEIAALNVDAAAIAAGLPTVGGLTAAKKAAEEAIKVLPITITVGDKDAVVGAWDAVCAYEELGGNAATLEGYTSYNSAITKLYDVMNTNFAIEKIKVDKKDKAALRTLMAEIEEANKMVGTDAIFGARNEFATADLETALDEIRDAEKAEVEKLFKALPINVTLADKAQIEAARAAYDAFVEEWTEYNGYDDYNAAAKVSDFRELALAEAAISVLEKDAAIKATEGLKISVSTKLYKGTKIRVSWKIKGGDASYVDGYQVWKSKKAQSGYTIMGKTTKSYMDNKKGLKKGTRYYYKVRAYVEIDGVKYYSDWSNKGNRIYK